MIPHNFLKALATQVGISDNEFEVLSRAIQGEPVSAISEKLGVRVDALQKRLGEVYKKFDIVGAGPGKLAKLQQILITEYQKQIADLNSGLGGDRLVGVFAEPSWHRKSAKSGPLPRVDWGQAGRARGPAPTAFYGRTQELATLEQWLIEDKSPLIAIVGMGGIGKTAIALRLAQHIQDQFECVIWRSLATAPPLSEILSDLLLFLSDRRETDLPETIDKQISQLIGYLRASRCLLVFDEVENILQSTGGDRDATEYEGYGKLFKKVAESRHDSCLILTSWTQPIEFAKIGQDLRTVTKETGFLYLDRLLKRQIIVKRPGFCVSPIGDEPSPVRVLELKGLPEESAAKLIEPSKYFGISETDLIAEIIHLYGGNPLLLKIVATNFQDLFTGNLAQFIKQNTLTVSNLVREFLTRHFENLSQLEIEVACRLASNGKPASQRDLQSSLMFSEEISEAIAALDSLARRSLIEQTTQGEEAYYTISSEVRQYLTHQLIAKYLNQLGHKKYLEGELQSAKTYLQQAIRYHPEFAHAQYNLGSTYEKLEDLPNARKHYQIAASSNNRAAHAAINNLARLEILNGNITEAIAQILPILPQVTDPAVEAAFHKNLGWAYLVQNRCNEAESHLRKAIDLNNLYVPAHCLLAQVLEAKGDNKAALRSWKNCLECEANDRKYERISWRLPELDIWRIQARQRLNG